MTNLERHLLSLSNRDFAARTHPAFTNRSEDLEMAELRAGSQRHGLDGDSIDSGNGCRPGGYP